jgi:eukaryotic-like serine/threonine-protein kinase
MALPPESARLMREQLERILASQTFHGAERSRTLLRFLVEQVLRDRADRLKEYTLGAEALGRGEAFDPRTDPIVRAEASRLRNRLDRYYTTDGQVDSLLIALPKGSYVPQLVERSAGVPAAESPTSTRLASLRYGLVWFALGCALTACAAAITAWSSRGPTPPVDSPLVQVEVELRSRGSLGSEVGTDVVLSRDGSRMAFVSLDAAGTAHLNTQRLDQANARELPGTEGARAQFFSPDGRWVGFWASGVLKRMPVDGGSPVPVCAATDLLGASWGEDGRIIAALSRGTLSSVPESGGTPTVVADLTSASLTPAWPQLLPGNRQVLFTALGPAGPNAANLEVLSLSDGARTIVVKGGTYGRFHSSGYLTYVNQGTLFAVPFDPVRLTVRGTAVPVLDDVSYSPTFGFAQVDVAQNGTLVYRKQAEFILVAMDAAGGTLPLLSAAGRYMWPRVSPDRQRLAFSGVESSSEGIWVHDIAADRTTRLPPGTEGYKFPVWSPDGRALVLGGPRGLGSVDPNGGEQPQPLLRSANLQVPWSFSPDGTRVAYHEMNAATGFDLWTVPVQTAAGRLTAATPEAFLRTASFEVYPSFSPDGKWLAYGSNESGTWQVYVRNFLDKSMTPVRVSATGGRIPSWSPNGRDLFYRTDHQQIMVTTYEESGGAFVVGKARAWSDGALADTGVLANFDASFGGNRIAALMPAPHRAQQTPNHVTVLFNFFGELRRRVPGSGK